MANYLTAQDVADRLNVSKRHVYYLIESRELPSIKFGPQVTRIDEKDLNEFIENRKGENATTS